MNYQSDAIGCASSVLTSDSVNWQPRAPANALAKALAKALNGAPQSSLPTVSEGEGDNGLGGTGLGDGSGDVLHPARRPCQCRVASV